ncbi:hypothetical protein SAMN02746065_1011, partial [Desulfocicer vacuolatum DSM 3385]
IDLLSHLYVMGIIIPRMVIQQNLFGSGLSRLGNIALCQKNIFQTGSPMGGTADIETHD